MERRGLIIWLTTVIVSVVVGFFQWNSGFKVSTNFLELFDRSSGNELEVSKVLKTIENHYINKSIVALPIVKNEDLDETLPKYIEQLCPSTLVSKCLWSSSGSLWEKVYKFYWSHRSYILIQKDQEKITSDTESYIKNKYNEAFSVFNALSSSQLASDPLGIFRSFLKSLESGDNFSKESEFLITEYEAVPYAFVFIDIKPDTPGIVEKWSQHVKEFRDVYPQPILVNSSYLYENIGAKKSMSEASTLGGISFIIIIFLLYFYFKSFIPIVLSIFTICWSTYVGFLFCHSFFGEIHIVSLLMGVGLLGLIIDYCIHYFSHINKDSIAKSNRVFDSIKKPFLLSLATSVLGYLSFSFADVSILQQLSLFAVSGLITAAFTVYFLFSEIKIKPLVKINFNILTNYIPKSINRNLLLLGLILLFSLISFNDDVRELQQRDQGLLAQENSILNILGRSKNISNYLISAGSEEKLLQKEESFFGLLKRHDSTSKATRVSSWVPSLKRQKESLETYQKLPEIGKELFDLLGVSGGLEKATNIYAKLDTPFIKLQAWKSDFGELPIAAQYLGLVGENYYSLLTQLSGKPLPGDQRPDGVFLWDKAQEVSEHFSTLRTSLLYLMAIVFVVICLLLLFWRGLSQTLNLIVMPMQSVVWSAIINFYIFGFLNIFHVLGLCLVFFLSIDYSFFKLFSKSKESAEFGVSLSMMTTIISFAALCLSSTAAVQHLGVSVIVGVILSACVFKCEGDVSVN